MEDFCLSLLFYPGVALQMSLTLEETKAKRYNDYMHNCTLNIHLG